SGAETREANARREIKAMIEAAKNEGRSNMTLEEEKRGDVLLAQVEAAKEEQAGVRRRLAKLREKRGDEDRSNARSGQPWQRTASLSVTRNERTYRPDTDPHGSGFVADVCRAQVMGDASAWARLARHMDEERVERPGYQEGRPVT